MNHAMWIAIAALAIGAFVRALKTDGASALLTKIAGRDLENGDEPVRIPTRALPFIALAAGALAGTLDAVVGGASWEDAAGAGAMAAASAVFGHELLSGVPGVKKALGLIVIVSAGMLGLQACTPDGRLAALETFAQMSACALANMNLPNEQILLKCGAQSLDDQKRLLRIVGTAREQAAHEAAGAYNRGLHDGKQAAGVAFCPDDSGPSCCKSDAGADGGKP